MSSLKVYEFVVTKDGEKVAEGSVLSRREAEECVALHLREHGENCEVQINAGTQELRVR